MWTLGLQYFPRNQKFVWFVHLLMILISTFNILSVQSDLILCIVPISKFISSRNQT